MPQCCLKQHFQPYLFYNQIFADDKGLLCTQSIMISWKPLMHWMMCLKTLITQIAYWVLSNVPEENGCNMLQSTTLAIWLWWRRAPELTHLRHLSSPVLILSHSWLLTSEYVGKGQTNARIRSKSFKICWSMLKLSPQTRDMKRSWQLDNWLWSQDVSSANFKTLFRVSFVLVLWTSLRLSHLRPRLRSQIETESCKSHDFDIRTES